MLKRMNNAGLLGWRLEQTRNTILNNYAAELQVTNFVITKSLDEDRLMAWPRSANEYAKLPPPPDIPDPPLFDFVRTRKEKLTGVWLDISNMSHNLQLPPAFRGLFPLSAIRFSDIDSETQSSVLQMLKINHINESELIRPSQRTMPMGFTWAVTLAHSATTSIICQAYNITTNAPIFKDFPHALKMFSRADEPYDLKKGLALAFAIIDDISIVVSEWPKEHLILFQKTLITLMTATGLRLSLRK